jgi:hypothetical protein
MKLLNAAKALLGNSLKYTISLSFCFGTFAIGDALISSKFFAKHKAIEESEELNLPSNEAEATASRAQRKLASVTPPPKSPNYSIPAQNDSYPTRENSQPSEIGLTGISNFDPVLSPAPSKSFMDSTVAMRSPAQQIEKSTSLSANPTSDDSIAACCGNPKSSTSSSTNISSSSNTTTSTTLSQAWETALWDQSTWGP